jgi:hypothetical protein
VFEHRVTKYDPAHRDRRGAYTREEWTSVSYIGLSFSNVILTEAEYQRVEAAYASAAIAFMREAGVESLAVVGLENHKGISIPFGEGSTLDLDDTVRVLQQVLRAEFWCRLESAGGFIHLGYDYYMYIGVGQRCPEAEMFACHLGLFVEAFGSPYREELPA